MTPQAYIQQEMDAGRLTLAHIEALVKMYQRAQSFYLHEDGKPGPETRARIEAMWPALFPKPPKPEDAAPFLSCPLPLLPGRSNPQARKPVVTSSYRTADRPDHDGLDFFYRWEPGDEPKFVGDGGCEGKNADGSPRWVVPYGTVALAAAAGVVQIAGPSQTGFRCWVDHGNGLRSGYFHLETLVVGSGAKVLQGSALGRVGHNPTPGKVDGRHLHFEVSPVEKYSPLNPHKYLLPW